MNREGYKDPTAEQAIGNANKISKITRDLMHALNTIAHLHGQNIVLVRDEKSGREWKP